MFRIHNDDDIDDDDNVASHTQTPPHPTRSSRTLTHNTHTTTRTESPPWSNTHESTVPTIITTETVKPPAHTPTTLTTGAASPSTTSGTTTSSGNAFIDFMNTVTLDFINTVDPLYPDRIEEEEGRRGLQPLSFEQKARLDAQNEMPSSTNAANIAANKACDHHTESFVSALRDRFKDATLLQSIAHRHFSLADFNELLYDAMRSVAAHSFSAGLVFANPRAATPDVQAAFEVVRAHREQRLARTLRELPLYSSSKLELDMLDKRVSVQASESEALFMSKVEAYDKVKATRVECLESNPASLAAARERRRKFSRRKRKTKDIETEKREIYNENLIHPELYDDGTVDEEALTPRIV